MSVKSMVTTLAIAAVAGSLAGQAPAQAQPRIPFPLAPVCTQWALNVSTLRVNVGNGVGITVPWDTNAKVFAGTGDATLGWPGGWWTGPVDGSILPSPEIHLNFEWRDGIGGGNYKHSKADGVIDSDGMASGTYVDQVGASYRWVSPDKFFCRDAPAAAPDKPLDVGAGASVGDHEVDFTPSPPPEEKPPTDAVRMTIAKQGLSIKISATSTAPIAGHCIYNAVEVNGLWPPVAEEFDIAKNGSHSFTKPAPGPFQKWHAVLSCSGDFNGQSVEFGHQEQDVS